MSSLLEKIRERYLEIPPDEYSNEALQAMRAVNEREQLLLAKLDEDGRKLFADYVRAVTEYQKIREEDLFCQGGQSFLALMGELKGILREE